MLPSSRPLPLLSFLAIAFVGMLAIALEGQVQTVPGKGKPKEPWAFNSTGGIPGNNGSDLLYTVPGNRVLVITDVVLSNNNATQPAFCRLFGGADFRFGTTLVPPNGVFDHTFGSGIEFQPGEQVVASNPGPAGTELFLALRGYLRKK